MNELFKQFLISISDEVIDHIAMATGWNIVVKMVVPLVRSPVLFYSKLAAASTTHVKPGAQRELGSSVDASLALRHFQPSFQ